MARNSKRKSRRVALPGRSGRPPVALVMMSAPAAKKEAPMARSRRSFKSRVVRGAARAAGLSYAAVTGSAGIEAGCSVSEGLFSLASAAIDFVTESTETTLDETAAGYLKPLAGTVLRVAAGRYLARRHPGLSEVLRAGASAMNGDSLGQMWRRKGVKAARTQLSKLAAEGQGSPPATRKEGP